jgi:hypothetical protein
MAVGVFPDGLDEMVIDELIAEATRQVGAASVPTSALLDGSAAERRRRRMARRAFTAVVRSLPAGRVGSHPVGEVA